MPFMVFSQVEGDYFLQYNKGYVYDEFNDEMDINPWSPDMQTEYEGKDDVKEGVRYSLGYCLTDGLVIGLNYMSSEIAGSNNIECYEGEFTEKNLFASYTILSADNLSLFATGSYGKVEWSATRELNFDGGVFPLNTYEGEAKKYAYGCGVSYMLTQDLELSFEVSRNEIEHDGFDGWDYGSNSDQYLYKTIGIRLYLKDE